jgi:hypothetical protein
MELGRPGEAFANLAINKVIDLLAPFERRRPDISGLDG